MKHCTHSKEELNRQRVMNKPYSTGLKHFTLADHYGFIWDTFLYKNKDTSKVKIFQIDREDRDTSTVVEIVKHFLERLVGHGHHIFMDKYYGSLEVMKLIQKYEHHMEFWLANQIDQVICLETVFVMVIIL